METMLAVNALAALAHEGRLEIFRLLVQAGPPGLVVGEIAAKLDLPGATLSFHLGQLQHAGLVHARRDGRRLIQTANFSRMTELIGYLTENCCAGASCATTCSPATVKISKSRKRTAA